MITIYKEVKGLWYRVGSVNNINYNFNSDKELKQAIINTESRYLFNHHDYMAQFNGKTKYFLNAKTPVF